MSTFKGYPKGTRFIFGPGMRIIGVEAPAANGTGTSAAAKGGTTRPTGVVSPTPGVSALGAGEGGTTLELKAPVLKSDERGLILGAPTKIDGNSVSLVPGLDPDELRLALLFWDYIESPQCMKIGQLRGTDGDFLESAGVLSSSELRVFRAFQAHEIILKTHLDTFKALESRDPGRWSLARGERSLSIVEPEAMDGRGLLLKLHHAVPIPSKEVPLDGVLSFREKRRPEMTELRHHLERLYQSIAAAPDRNLAEATELAALDKAMADHIKVLTERKFPLRLTSLEAKFNQSSVGAGMLAGVAATMAGLPAVAALLAGIGMAVGASINLTVGFRPRVVQSTPFEYVSIMHQEL